MFTQEHLRKNYARAGITVGFWGKSGYDIYPSSGSGRGVLVQESGPTGGFVVEFALAAEGGDWPLVPDPTPRSSNDVLTDWAILPHAPSPDVSGGQRVYRVEGYYVYKQYTPLLPGKDTFYVGRIPVDDAQAVAIRLSPKYFDKAILGQGIDSGLAGTQPSAAFNPINIIGR